MFFFCEQVIAPTALYPRAPLNFAYDRQEVNGEKTADHRPQKCGGLGMTDKLEALGGILGLFDTLVDIGVSPRRR